MTGEGPVRRADRAGGGGDGGSRAERIANVTYTAPTETGEVESTLDDEHRPAAQRADGAPPWPRGLPRVGRNDPCPCGSGKKYKHCHGS
jgi:preprotein translocase subunit SecA